MTFDLYPAVNFTYNILNDVYYACQYQGFRGKLDLVAFAGMPAETAQAICCMIFGGVLERYPRLKVCFAHGGID